MRKHIRPMNMRREVAIPQMEPNLAPVYPQALQKMKRLPAHAPARRWIDHSGQRVRNDIQVRRNLQPMHHNVIASIYDNSERVWVHRAVEPEQQL